MLNEFENKVAVITGAGSGIGAALAKGFINQGMRVVVADIVQAQAEQVASALGENALARQVDVADSEQVQALAVNALAARGQANHQLGRRMGCTPRRSWARNQQ